ncbi:DUF805 domain-containing protein, partial [Lacticaseibacillus rhamnosus]|nr:DUF805 domain-containing protein [Lacticaseibacillus rhamnosus]
MDQMLQPYYRYADFQGRSSRSEYWMFVLFNVLVITGLVIVTLIGLFSAGGTG